MKKIFLIFILISLISLNNLFSQIIYDFNSKLNLKDWYIVNDDVMGGVSFSQLEFDNNGNIIFNGQISLDNNGGFASMQCDLSVFNLSRKKVINLRVKGDEKTYQLRRPLLVLQHLTKLKNKGLQQSQYRSLKLQTPKALPLKG